MYPFELNINIIGFQLQMGAYTLFFLLAILIAVIGGTLYARHRGFLWRQVLVILLGMLLAGVVGARLLNLLTNLPLYLENPDRFWQLSATGFSLYGGLIFAVITGYLLTRFFKINAWHLGDTLVPFLGLSIATMRVGCFLEGCCFGRETNLPWGVEFPLVSPAHLHQITEHGNFLTVHAVHPTQFYELIAALILSLIAFYMHRKNQPTGRVLMGFLIFFSLFRLLNSALRVEPGSFSAEPFVYPLLYLVIGAIIVLLLFLPSMREKLSTKRQPD